MSAKPCLFLRPRMGMTGPPRLISVNPVFNSKERPVKNAFLGVFLVAVAAGVLVPCFAAAPAKLNKVAPVADLVAEAEAKIKSLEESLATNASYLEKQKKSIPEDAGVLAILSQAIAEHEDKAAWKASAPDLRDAAISVAESKTYDAAKKGLAAIKDAHGGKAGPAKKDHDWNKLAKLENVMAEVNKRNGLLRKDLRKSAPPNPDQSSRDASVLAVLALVAQEDTHPVKKKEDIPAYKKLAVDMQASMTEAAATLKKKDFTAASAAFKKANTSCNTCHADFRDQ